MKNIEPLIWTSLGLAVGTLLPWPFGFYAAAVLTAIAAMAGIGAMHQARTERRRRSRAISVIDLSAERRRREGRN